ncbi:right-handed parallel beta-helix repeat-containing protein [Microbacterium phosphatis]|uniref:right-handed parallel beta-helix repeat-containing protein n=1 Tax=Microbacterium phosphatis TaxID=3140248 RepID=UPI00313FF4FC
MPDRDRELRNPAEEKLDAELPNEERELPAPKEVSRRSLFWSVAIGAGAGGAMALAGSEALRSFSPPADPVLSSSSGRLPDRFDDQAEVARLMGVFLPEVHALPGDRDDQAIRRAAEAAASAGGGTVLLSQPVYHLGSPVALNGLSDVTFESRSRSVIRAANAAVKLEAFVGAPGARDADGAPLDDAGASQITIRGLTFDGGLVNGADLDAETFYDVDEEGRRVVAGTGAFARDARTYLPAGADDQQPREALFRAVFVAGDADPSSRTSLRFSNILIEQVRLIGIASLPIYLRGVRGLAAVDDSYAYRCLDIGFTYCENVRFNRNHIEYSADNGVSISRGNSNVNCSANIITKAWYYGIHLGGFGDEAGAQHVSCTGNTVVHSGQIGINLYDAPADVTVTGNLIADVHRGATDDQTDVQGYGMLIQGLKSEQARNIVITGNSFARAHRAGICISQFAEDILIAGNVFHRIGMPTLPDGRVAEPGGSWNYVVGRPGGPGGRAGTVRRIVVAGNAMFDDRQKMIADDAPRVVGTWPGGADFAVRDNYMTFGSEPDEDRPANVLPLIQPGEDPPSRPGTMGYDQQSGRVLVSDGRKWRDSAGELA